MERNLEAAAGEREGGGRTAGKPGAALFAISAGDKLRLLGLYARGLSGLVGPLGTVALFAGGLLDWSRLRGRLVPAGASRSLREIADAVLWNAALVRCLTGRLGADRALAAVKALVLDSGLVLMRASFPPPDAGDPLGSLARFVEGAMAEANDAGIYVVEGLRHDASELRFDTTFCIYQKLSAEAGVPELAPAFCEVDGPFFETYDPSIRFERETSLAMGGARCPFRFSRRTA